MSCVLHIIFPQQHTPITPPTRLHHSFPAHLNDSATPHANTPRPACPPCSRRIKSHEPPQPHPSARPPKLLLDPPLAPTAHAAPHACTFLVPFTHATSAASDPHVESPSRHPRSQPSLHPQLHLLKPILRLVAIILRACRLRDPPPLLLCKGVHRHAASRVSTCPPPAAPPTPCCLTIPHAQPGIPTKAPSAFLELAAAPTSPLPRSRTTHSHRRQLLLPHSVTSPRASTDTPPGPLAPTAPPAPSHPDTTISPSAPFELAAAVPTHTSPAVGTLRPPEPRSLQPAFLCAYQRCAATPRRTPLEHEQEPVARIEFSSMWFKKKKHPTHL